MVSVPGQKYSPNVEEYLEELYRLTEEDDPYVSTGDLARRLEVKAPSVTEMLRSLGDRGLVEYEPYRGAALTEEGLERGRKLVEKHRLVERLLTEVLGLDWSEVHDEACELEHAISDQLEEKIREALEDPETCPHGNPVSGEADDVPLDELEPGVSGTVSSVSDEDPEALQEMKTLRLVPDAEVRVLERRGEVTVLRIDGREEELDPGVSKNVRVDPTEA